MKKRVTVLVIGPTRTATTALWQGLKGVETVSVASTKENYFFGRRIAGKSDQPYGDYLSKHFARNIRVDFEPSIFHSDDQLREAFATPGIDRFVGILRPPLDLYKSAYGYNTRNGMTYNGFEAFFQQASGHYDYSRVAAIARDAEVSIVWLPHDALITDLRVLFTATGVPCASESALPLMQLNSSQKQVSAIGRIMKRARALKKLALVRTVAERVRGSWVYEKLVYSARKQALSIPASELAAVRASLAREEAFYLSILAEAKRSIADPSRL
ncbi:hypothetical protein [Pseudosulfitobacter pseudonitzschiae]|uniref:hypothetical protein n=1 Tax=Pseudosulfitobacter pseudonitzschiae TaxID=1402135 RepID=UPI001AF395FE|nr:hypothetical protein [Pseudosulfitobacter pseudonitzschiae]MBM1817358.1 hypothetical protein [Pseudosulfitobacter pseudonitzschiae]MBM1834556.1 hypothetical protein [Pseudosulfitobacter pseudonitzschiae]MBM1839421.1 hypothetical protein [Pseudosulfitobacter pseudonitzschiae]MBM1844271.1 hypothetical protein [Pseudosulfitobacter pseudonitzschiae]MBM1849106.1 hypothetical protein [Pseudosulfitobacter pseudonitzschiae]